MPIIVTELSSDQNLDNFVRSPNSPFDPEERFDLIDPRLLLNDTDIRNDRTFSSEKIVDYFGSIEFENYYTKTAIDDFFAGTSGGKKTVDWSKVINKEGSDFTYSHSQGVSSATWTITHNLGYKPSVSVFDSSNKEVIGNIVHTNSSQLVITFSAAFAGNAYLS